jgi:hypothetical protein
MNLGHRAFGKGKPRGLAWLQARNGCNLCQGFLGGVLLAIQGEYRGVTAMNPE